MRRLILLAIVAGTTLCSPAFKTDNNDHTILQTKDVKRNKHQLSDKIDDIEEYVKNSDVSFQLPLIGSTVTFEGRNLDKDELDVKIDFNSGSETEARKKSKIKKIFAPILVFILLKAIVLIPLALGIVGIKAWNAIQLSFISFVTAAALAVWTLCSKLNHHPAPNIIHSDWDHHHHDRSDAAQQMVYSGYVQQ